MKIIKKILIALGATAIIGGGLIAGDLLGGKVFDDTILDTKLTEVYEKKNVNVFQNEKTSEIKEVEITDEEVKALGEKDAKQPYLEGYKWLYSKGGVKIPFKSEPVLQDYQYYESGVDSSSSTVVKIKLPDKAVSEIKKDDIVNDKLTPVGLEKIK